MSFFRHDVFVFRLVNIKISYWSLSFASFSDFLLKENKHSDGNLLTQWVKNFFRHLKTMNFFFFFALLKTFEEYKIAIVGILLSDTVFIFKTFPKNLLHK